MIWPQWVVGFVVAGAVTFVLIPRLISFAHSQNLLDHPGQHKRHSRPVPLLGGVALFVALWLSVAVAILAFDSIQTALAGSVLYILLGGLIIFLTGLSDDLRPLSAWTKLFSQVAAGLVLYMGGLQIDPLSIPFYGPVEMGPFSVIITIVWVVGLTNAINLIDGLDGLAGGVSLVGALSLSVLGWLFGVPEVALFTSAMVGFLVVFLWYNFYPARIFLGDNGSLQLGYYFAVISLLVPVKSFTAAALYVPLLALGLPLLEAVLSFTRRLVSGRNVMAADRRHIFHYLALAGFSPRTTLFVFCGLSTGFGLLSIAMFFWNRLLVLGLLILFMVVIFIIFFILMSNLTRFRRLARSRKTGSTQTDDLPRDE